jgi:hypothetical protein
MDDSLTQPTAEELAEIIRHGRINAKKSSRRRTPRKESQPSMIMKRPSKEETRQKEPDSEWLKIQMEKTERNISAPLHDKRRKSDMEEASRF